MTVALPSTSAILSARRHAPGRFEPMPTAVELEDEQRRADAVVSSAAPATLGEAIATLRGIGLLPVELAESHRSWTPHQVRLVAALLELRGDLDRHAIARAKPREVARA